MFSFSTVVTINQAELVTHTPATPALGRWLHSCFLLGIQGLSFYCRTSLMPTWATWDLVSRLLCMCAQTHVHTHAHTHITLSHTLTHALSHTLTHTLTHALSLTHTLIHTHSHVQLHRPLKNRCFLRGELLSQDYTKSKDQSWGPSTSLLTAYLVFAVPSWHTTACFRTPLSITLLILTFIFSQTLNLGSTLAAETQIQSLRLLVYPLTFWSTKFCLFTV